MPFLSLRSDCRLHNMKPLGTAFLRPPALVRKAGSRVSDALRALGRCRHQPYTFCLFWIWPQVRKVNVKLYSM